MIRTKADGVRPPDDLTEVIDIRGSSIPELTGTECAQVRRFAIMPKERTGDDVSERIDTRRRVKNPLCNHRTTRPIRLSRGPEEIFVCVATLHRVKATP